MKLKKILSLIIAGIMMLAAFTACGGDGGNGGTTTTPETTAPVDNTPEYTYKRVVIIGVDGMGAFGQQADTPNIDRIFADGVTTYTAQTAFPSISAQSWGSLLIGSSAYAHGLNNSIVESNPYENSELPTVFKRVRDAMPDALLASYCDWEPVNTGIIEDNIGVVKENGKDIVIHSDIATYLTENDPTLFYAHFDSPDASGHGNGYGSERHLKQITIVDGYIGTIYDAMADAGKLEDTLFIVTTDHGGTPGGSHGGTTEAEMNIFFGAVGKTVKKGGTVGEMNIRDTAAVVLYALGIEIPAFNIDGFSAQLPDGIFEGYTAPERQSIISGESAPVTLTTPEKDSGKYITDIMGADKVASVFHFNDNTDDSLGVATPAVQGTPKYYGTGYFDTCIELGTQGYISMPGTLPAEGNFSTSVWFEHNRDTSSYIVLFASHNRTETWHQGISATYNGYTVEVTIGNGDASQTIICPLSEMMPETWTNLTVSFNKDERTLTAYINFKEVESLKYSKRFTVEDFVNSDNFTFGNDPAEFNGTNIMLDEFVIFKSALTTDEVAKLAEYYSYGK